jgi:hypothetical protein
MRAPKPQLWMRPYSGGLVMRIETDRGGPWRVTGNGATEGSSWRTSPLAAMQTRADHLAGAKGVGSWRRVCRRCDALMTLDARNRPDSGPQFQPDYLWVCTSPLCNHAEPADD